MIINSIATIMLIIWANIVMMSPMMVAASDFDKSSSSMWILMGLVSYPVVMFAVMQLAGWHYFGTEATYWLIGSTFLAGAVIFAYGLPGMLLNLKKGISNHGYCIHASGVYLNGRKIVAADPSTFNVEADTRYARDKSHVFFGSRLLANADPQTFSPVEPTEHLSTTDSRSFWKDARQVYYEGKPIERADPATFRHAGHYGWDSLYVYYGNRRLDQANAASFRVLKHGIATDGASVFVFGKRSRLTVDLASFEVFDEDGLLHCKDQKNVYVFFFPQPDPMVLVEGADPASFTPLERSYAKDKNHVYFIGPPKVVLLTGVAPGNFEVGYQAETKSDARDGERFFSKGVLVKPPK
jgi:hypothetical protein